MDQRKSVLHEVLIIGIGEAIGVAAMFGVYALLSRLDGKVLLGGIIGMLVALGNFFFMAISASLAADKAAGQDVKGGKVLMQISYPVRLLGMFLILFVSYKSGKCELFSLLIPLLFTRPTILVANFFRKPGEKQE